MIPQPLGGLRIVVTRATQDAKPLLEELSRLGAVPIHAPSLAFSPPKDRRRLSAALRGIASYDWAVFTSVHGVEAVFPAGSRRSRRPATLRFAAIGPASRDALLSHDVPVSFVPSVFTTENLARELPDVAGRRIVLFRAEVGNPALVRILEERGAKVDDVAAYRTLPDRPPSDVRRDILEILPDWVLFTSPSSVEHFSSLWSGEELQRLRSAARAACIGPVTGDAAREHGWAVRLLAQPHTIDGLVQALMREVTPHA